MYNEIEWLKSEVDKARQNIDDLERDLVEGNLSYWGAVTISRELDYQKHILDDRVEKLEKVLDKYKK